MHPLITQAIVTGHVRELHTHAAAAAQARQARQARQTRQASRSRFALVRAGLLAGPKDRRALRAA